VQVQISFLALFGGASGLFHNAGVSYTLPSNTELLSVVSVWHREMAGVRC